MASDAMSVRLWLSLIDVLGGDAPEELVVRGRSTVRRQCCPGHGTPSGQAHDRGRNTVRDLEVSGRLTPLAWEPWRMVREPCVRRFAEEHLALEGLVTARLALHLVIGTRAITVNTDAKLHELSWKLAKALVVAYVGLVAGRRRQRCCSMRPRSTSGTGTRRCWWTATPAPVLLRARRRARS